MINTNRSIAKCIEVLLGGTCVSEEGSSVPMVCDRCTRLSVLKYCRRVIGFEFYGNAISVLAIVIGFVPSIRAESRSRLAEFAYVLFVDTSGEVEEFF